MRKLTENANVSQNAAIWKSNKIILKLDTRYEDERSKR